MADILSEIIAHKRKEVTEAKNQKSYAELERQLARCSHPLFSMKAALENSDSGIIAEFKRKSPSKGWIAEGAQASVVPADYELAGAAALSVLTDTKFFGGSLADLEAATQRVKIPVMRKEFIVDEYQLLEARLSGASAILLIAAALSVDESRRFTHFAAQLGLETLLELHHEQELDYVQPENTIIGINNRNLGTFVTDVNKSYKMIERLPKTSVLVSESGISNPDTVGSLRKVGYRGFLIGENFMKTQNPGNSLRHFIAAINNSIS